MAQVQCGSAGMVIAANCVINEQKHSLGCLSHLLASFLFFLIF